MYIEIGKVFDVDGLSIFQMQNRNAADVIYEDEEERQRYDDDLNYQNYGYKAEDEGYGDEYEYNMSVGQNGMNFSSQRADYQPLRSKQPNHSIRIRGGQRERNNQQRQNGNFGLHIDVPKISKTYGDYNDTEPEYGQYPGNNQTYQGGIGDRNQVPDEYKNDPELYWAM